MDELTMNRASGHVHAVTVRLYNPATRQWSIYWTASSHPGRMDVPMVGKFDGPHGEFYSQEVFEGRHIFNRFIWNVDSSDSCRWKQAFSAGRRQDLGDQLDHEVHPPAVNAAINHELFASHGSLY
jgi:hypothetical protein